LARPDDQEFHDFVEFRMDRWRRSAFLMCQDWHTADDLVSIAVTKLYRHWSEVRRADNPDAYAQKVLTRSWLSERRRPWRREHTSDEVPDRPVVAPDRVTDRESLSLMLKALGPRQRAVLVLRYYFDYSVEETAEMLQISAGTVKSQTARGLERLRAGAQALRG
jgi:RNA polymerase sigma-70 factor (sigma-E family)